VVRPLVRALLLLAAAAAAQEGEVGQPYWVSTPPGAAAALKQAVGSVAAQDWNAAARALQTVFDRYPAAFAKSGDGYRGTRAWAVQILASAPPGLREEYERLYGPAAEEALRQALATADRRGLLEVVRSFEGTASGLRAALALADDALQRGRPAEARQLLSGTARLHPAAARDERIRRRAALAAARDHAEGGPAPRPEEGPAAAAPAPDESWPILGGNAARDRVASRPSFHPLRYAIDLDIRQRQWDQAPQPDSNYFPYPRRRRDDDSVWRTKWDSYDPVQPVISRGILVASDGQRVGGFNLFSGEPLWRYPENVEVEHDGRTDLNAIFTPVVADGVVYVALEAPIPFHAQKLQDVPIIYYLPMRRLVALDLETGELLWRHDDEFFDARPESALLRSLSVTGAPIARGDRLYAGAVASEGTFHSHIVAIDRQTGELVYATRVGNGQQELNLFGRQLQECVPMPLVEVQGVLYYGTNLGIVAAVDALLGTPIWAAPYPTVTIPSTYFWFEAPRRWPRFANGPPLVSGSTLVALPPDGDYLIGLDRRTGELAFRLPPQVYPGERALDLRTLHGVDAERAYVGGSRGVAALWLVSDAARGAEPGEIAWTAWFAEGDAGAGRGILAQDALWVPTQVGITRLDPATGKVLSAVEREGRDGDLHVHLVWGDGVLLTAGRRLVGARFDREAVLALARERARLRPDEPGPLLEAADIHLGTGQVSQAVELYLRAKTLAEARGAGAAARRAQQGLHRALLRRAQVSLGENALERAQGEFDAAIRAAPDDRARLKARRELEQALAGTGDAEARKLRARNLRAIERDHGEQPDEANGRPIRGWALLRLAELMLAEDDPRRALGVLQQIVERDPEGEDGRQASRAIAQLIERPNGRELYDAYEKRAAKLFETALAAGDLEAVERGLRIYANAAAAGPAALELAARQLRAHDPTGAARTLQAYLADHPGSPRTAEALLLMVEALHERSSHGPAYAALLRLRTRHAGTRVARADGTRAPAGAIAEEWLAREPYASLARSARRRDLSPELRHRFDRTVMDAAVDVPDLLGLIPEALRGTVVLRTGNRVRILDAESGAERRVLDFGVEQPKGPLVLAGDRLYATTEGFVHVFDAGNGRLLHRRKVPDGGRALSLVEHRGQVFLLYRERRVQGEVGLAALHPLDGSTLWSGLLPAGAVDPAGADYYAVAHEDRLLLFSTQPVEVWVIDPTSGAVDNRIVLETSPGAQRPLEPVFLPGGRVLVGIVTRQQAQGFQYRYAYTLFLVDPGAAGDAAIVWKYRPRGDEKNRFLQHLNVAGDYVAAIDEERGASVLELETGREVKRTEQLEVPGTGDEVHYLDGPQPRHDSLLLAVTRSMNDTPGRLSSYELPDLRPRYSVELTDSGRDTPRLIDAQGVLAVAIGPRKGRVGQPRIRLLDPVAGRLLDELVLPAADLTWISAKVQNGILLVTTNTQTVYAYGPR
jgi:outer membrane protein assembly factor BamB